MNITKEKEWEYIARFDSFIKRVIKNHRINLWKSRKHITDNEKPMSECSQRELLQTQSSIWDFLDVYEVKVLGYLLKIRGSEIFTALHTLEENKRTIILLYYYLGMNDNEIALRLHLERRNVTRIRNQSLATLRKLLGGVSI